ncbi:MAG: PIN domain-containing protein [Candidatus Obscuribacterales bacterium]|nr:PIN domain-containing protein [Candidatus Obscuribacterales bacterium]
MSLYLLDTCTLSDFFAGNGNTKQKLGAMSPSSVALSTVTIMEILYGFELNLAIAKKFSTAFGSLCASVQILPFDQAAAEAASVVRAKLKVQGTPIGSFDLLIAATALASNSILVTSNTREFKRVDKLKIENWR